MKLTQPPWSVQITPRVTLQVCSYPHHYTVQHHPAASGIPRYARRNNQGFKNIVGVLYCRQQATIIAGCAVQKGNVENPSALLNFLSHMPLNFCSTSTATTINQHSQWSLVLHVACLTKSCAS